MVSSGRIMSMLKDAESCRQRGLLRETVEQYRKVEAIIRGIDGIKNKDSLLEKISRRIDAIGREIHESSLPAAPETIAAAMPAPVYGKDLMMPNISRVRLTLPEKTGPRASAELNVLYQHGDKITVVVSQKEPALIECLQSGVRIDCVFFYSSAARFSGSVHVLLHTKIDFGPQAGDARIHMKLYNISGGG